MNKETLAAIPWPSKIGGGGGGSMAGELPMNTYLLTPQ